MAFSTSLETQTVITLSVYATSSFLQHSLVSTVLVVQGIVNGTQPPFQLLPPLHINTEHPQPSSNPPWPK